MNLISNIAIIQRNLWIDKINQIENDFATSSDTLHKELSNEISKDGYKTLLNHLRLCRNIPESYRHDSSDEELYSNYSYSILSFAYKSIGLKSHVIKERADVADVEGFAQNFNFVADAKAFRLSRTAKNQKDFKIQAMDRWKHGKKNAMVVCPIYQLPTSNSQIYHQSITRNVLIFTYSHLALLVRFANEESHSSAEELLFDLFEIIPTLNPSKSAVDYWMVINRMILKHSKLFSEFWKEEKILAAESIEVGKLEALSFLAKEREKIITLSHEDALNELLKMSKIESKEKTINNYNSNNLKLFNE